MSIQVRFFASLREQLGQGECEIPAVDAATIQEVWHVATKGQALPQNILCALNMEYVTLDHAVTDGDEVAYFPPVTGG